MDVKCLALLNKLLQALPIGSLEQTSQPPTWSQYPFAPRPAAAQPARIEQHAAAASSTSTPHLLYRRSDRPMSAAGSQSDFSPDNSNLSSIHDQVVSLAESYGHFWTQIQKWNLIKRADESRSSMAMRSRLHWDVIRDSFRRFRLLYSLGSTISLKHQKGMRKGWRSGKAWLKAEWEKGGIVPLDQRPAPPPGRVKRARERKRRSQRAGFFNSKGEAEDGDRRKRQKSE